MNSSPHDGGQVNVRALIASPDGKNFVKASELVPLGKIHGLGKKIAARLLDGGGTVSIVGGNVTTTGVGANAVFSYGGNGGTNGGGRRRHHRLH